jgi:hypothetical protein
MNEAKPKPVPKHVRLAALTWLTTADDDMEMKWHDGDGYTLVVSTNHCFRGSMIDKQMTQLCEEVKLLTKSRIPLDEQLCPKLSIEIRAFGEEKIPEFVQWGIFCLNPEEEIISILTQ